jgi:hypothetical protein
MQQITVFLLILLACGNIVKAMHEEDISAQKVASASRSIEPFNAKPKTEWEINEELIVKGDPQAIRRKIEGLAYGGDRYRVQSTHSLYGSYRFHPTYGYEKNPQAAREFNDSLIERGDQEAIKRKINALTRGGDAYEVTDWFDYMPSVTRYYPTYGYEKDPEAAKEFEKFIRARFTSL